jgi:hypothetical protein
MLSEQSGGRGSADSKPPRLGSGQKYAVDRWPFDQGENPAMVKVEDWYIKDK